AIALGKGLHPLARLRDGGRCTWFLPTADARSARKNWIAGSLTPAGHAVIDDGAVRALVMGSSLLPAGVTAVAGDFDRGDLIAVLDRNGQKIACGLAAYAADEARRIAGHQSDEIESLLGWQGEDELIHRDDLVLLARTEPATT
ncbi:PUA domain-containing protein, partial [Komagataeibacter kakiaceti]|uniref:PUA domain-containing protein n=1 Tax=Komagataeibacter kakiaceti TaxID=943261 RepID=UPI00046F78E9